MILEANITKICLWRRVCAGLYKLGNITVSQIWHSEGICAGNHMWHVIVDGRTVEKWAYLKDAKERAHRIDKRINKINRM